ncbi:MAG: B12-binding domain-containing radical SAM protein [Candidatus Altiarchaeota archaeon]|nr:B12-binding domain-containing radical SAM protein [Candidatus Altiarchaeota archaeon]
MASIANNPINETLPSQKSAKTGDYSIYQRGDSKPESPICYKVLLINVCYPYPVVTEGAFAGINKIWQPLELAYALAKLKGRGHDARLLDSNALRVKPEKTGEYAEEYDLIFVSSTSYDRWECPHLNLKPTVETIKSIKKANKNAVVIIVGSHGSVRPKEMIDETGADAVLVGEPEDAIPEIADSKDWKKTPGIAYVEEGKLSCNERTTSVGLDSLPLPDFSDLPMKRYFMDLLGGDFAVLEASRSCPFNCNYCLKKMFGTYRRKSFKKLKSEIEYVMKEYKVKKINFVDLEFTVNRKLVEELCDWMIKDRINLKWSCQTRLDSVDEKLLRKMKDAGCRYVMYGVESGSQKIIDYIGKNITLEDFRKGMTATKEAGLGSVCFFMFGFPGETDEDREKTVELALELDPDYASFFLVRPYPGTRCFDEVTSYSPGLFPHAIGSDEEILKLKRYCDRAFSRYYYRPKTILRRLLSGELGVIGFQIKVFLYKVGVLHED